MKALEKTVEQLQGDLGKANEKIGKLNDEAVKASKGVAKLSKQFRSFAASLLAAGTAQAAFNTGLDRIQSNARLVALARGYEEIEQAQAAATRTAEAFNLSQTEANKQFAAIYGRLRPLGLTVEQIEDAYAGLSTAVKTASLDAAGASALFTQVSQALGSGVVQAEELNTVIDQAPSIVVALAKELGVTAGEVKKLASTGQVSSEQLFKALLRVKDEGVDVLSESLNTPAEKIKAFYNTTEDIVAALTTAVIPELVDGVDDIAAALEALIPLAQVVGRTLSAAFKLAAIPAKGFGDLLANISQGNWEAVLKFDPSGFQKLGDIFGDLFAPLPGVKTGGGRRGGGSSNFPTIPNRGGSSGSSGGGGGTSAADILADQMKAGKELMQQLEREAALRAVVGDEAKQILKIEYDRQDLIKQINETAAESQKLQLTELANANALAKTEELKKKFADEALAAKVSALSSIEDEIALQKAIVTGAEEEYKWKKMIQDLAANANVSTAEATAKVNELKLLTEQAKAYQQLQANVESLSNSISSNLTGAFKSVIDGSKSMEEAMSDALAGIGQAFIDMAMQIIQQQMAMIVNGLIMKALGIPMGGSSFGAFDMFSSAPQGFNNIGPMTRLPMMGYANGGAPPMNEPSIVGERGPELFIPNTSGRVVSNEAMGAYSPGGNSGGGGGATGPINISYSGPTLNFNGDDYIPRSEAPKLVEQGAKAGEARTMNSLRNSRTARSRVGV